MAYDAGDYRRLAQEGDGARRRQRLRQAQARERAARQAARHRLFDLHRGLRHRAVAGGRLARRRRRPVGIRRSARQSDRLGRGADRLAQPRPGPRDDLRAARVASGSAFRSRTSAIVHGDTDKVQFGMGTYGSRSGAVGMSAIVKALDKVEAKAKKVAAYHDGSGRRRHRVQGRQVHRRRHRQVGRPGATSRSTPMSRTNSPARELEPGLKEGAFYDPTNFTFPAGCHICEVEIDPDTGRTEIVELDRGRRFRHRHQSDDRRGPGARRHRAGHRPGAARGRRLRQGRPARDRLVHGLLDAARATTCRRSRSARPRPSARPIRSASRAAARRARSPRRPRSSTPSPMRIGTEEIAMPATAEAVWSALSRKATCRGRLRE